MIRYHLPRLLTCLAVLLSTCRQLPAQTITFPIKNGVLQSALDANSQPVNKLSRVTIGTITPSTPHAINLTGTGNTAVEGIQFGGDTELYRSVSGRLTLDGDLLVTGSVSDAGGTPLRPSGNNTWTGINTLNGTTNLTGGGTVGGSGLSFTSGTPVNNTRLSLGLRPGVDIQAFSTLLRDIVNLSLSNNAFLVSNGTTWTALNGAAARTAMGVGTGSSPAFTGLTLTGTLTAVGGSFSGVLQLPAATTVLDALLIGDTPLYGTGSVLTTSGGLAIGGSTVLGDSSGDTARVTGTLYFGGTGVTDAGISRTGSGVITTSAAFIASELRPAASLSTTYGGTGLNLSATTANQMLYTSATGVLSTSALAATSRGFLAFTSAAQWRSGLELGTAALTSTGTGSSNTILGNDARLTDSRTPTGSAGGSLAGTYPNPTLTASGVTAATYGTSTQIPQITVGTDGRVTGATNILLGGLPPGGSIASGSLAGSSYPNPTVAPDAIALGTQTTGNYVQSITGTGGISIATSPSEGAAYAITLGASDIIALGTQTTGNYVKSVVAGTGVTVSSAGEGVDTTVSIPQAVATTSSPTFSALSITNTATVGQLSGVIHNRQILVDPDNPDATDTRAVGVSNYDTGIPFDSLSEAYGASSTGDIVVLRPATSAYPAQTLSNTGVDLLVEEGAILAGVSISSGTATVYGKGKITSTGTAVSATGGTLTIHPAIQSSDPTPVSASGGATVLTLLGSVTTTSLSSGAVAISTSAGQPVVLGGGVRLS